MSYVVGSRASKLSNIQTEEVLEELRNNSSEKFVGKDLETLGDKERWKKIEDMDETGVFTRELDRALIAGEIDIAVHSTKDVPTDFNPKMAVGAVCERNRPNDVIIGGTLEGLEEGAKIGTGSPRRKNQILRKRPDLEVVPIRGNVETRIGKVGDEVDAVVLAEIGVKRMGMEDMVDQVLEVESFLPAPGQAGITVMCRKDDEKVLEFLEKIDHKKSRIEVETERAVLNEFGMGCSVPLGTLAKVEGDKVYLTADYLEDYQRVELEGSVEEHVELGHRAARMLKEDEGI